MHTAHHIYARCISGELLRDRTVILVTHHIALCLPSASYLVQLSSGQVVYQGTIDDLRQAGHLAQVNNDDDMTVEGETDSSSSIASPMNEADLIPVGEKTPQVSKSLKGKLVEAEARAEGRVQTSTYLTYLRACGWSTWVSTLLLMLFIHGITIATQVRNLLLVRLCITFLSFSFFFFFLSDVPCSVGTGIRY